MRYVERNALRANFVDAAEDWKWGSAYFRRLPKSKCPSWLKLPENFVLPRNWRSLVNKPLTEKEAKAIQNCIRRGAHLGVPKNVATQIATRLRKASEKSEVYSILLRLQNAANAFIDRQECREAREFGCRFQAPEAMAQQEALDRTL